MDFLPAWYYSNCGAERFAVSLKREIAKHNSVHGYEFVMLDGESKLNFYMQLPPTTQHFGVNGKRQDQNMESLQQQWPMLKEQKPNVIVISRKLYAPILDQAFPQYTKVSLPHQQCLPFVSAPEENEAVAYIP